MNSIVIGVSRVLLDTRTGCYSLMDSDADELLLKWKHRPAFQVADSDSRLNATS